MCVSKNSTIILSRQLYLELFLIKIIYSYLVSWIPIKSSWPTVVEGDPKASFLIAIMTRCREKLNSFLWIAPLTLYSYLIMLNFRHGGIKYHFGSFGMTRHWIEPRSRGPLANVKHYLNLFLSNKSNFQTNLFDQLIGA